MYVHVATLASENSIELLTEEVQRRSAERVGQVGERPEVLAVQVAPHQGGDHDRDGVRHEDADPEELGEPDLARVEDQREHEGQDQHDRHLDEHVQRHPLDPVDELLVLEAVRVVVEPDERVASDELLAEQAQVQRVDRAAR